MLVPLPLHLQPIWICVFFEPNIFHVMEAIPTNNTEGDQENVCSLIGQHSYSIEILLPSCIPKTALLVNISDI